MFKGKYGVLGIFDPFWHVNSLFWCLWLVCYVAMTVWHDLWLISIVRLVENVVEWRKQVAGKSCRKLCRVSDRIRYGLGSDWRSRWGTRPELEPGTKEAWQKGRPFTLSWSGERGSDRKNSGGQIGSTQEWEATTGVRQRERIGSE